ncbi:MAG: prepilin peptidase [Patescibacteria group bacterium]|nr:prepilin peptidase [Patescibacteria group bacterium]
MAMISLFIIGVFVGSFLNVVVDRLKSGETIIKGRSRCEFCKKELAWFDLIPLFSFIFLKGKCRYCHKKLSLYYPIIELSTGALSAFTYLWISQTYHLPFTIYHLAYYLIIISAFIIIFFEDLKFGIIPDKVVFPAIVVTFFYSLIFNPQSLIINLFSATLTFAFFLILFLITKGKGMGFGDVKLSLLLGLVLGFPKIIPSLYLAFLTGAIIGIILIIWRKKKSLKDTIPFGPFLIIGALAGLFWGQQIYAYFLSLLGI